MKDARGAIRRQVSCCGAEGTAGGPASRRGKRARLRRIASRRRTSGRVGAAPSTCRSR
jgi:hypothetical protein